MAAVQNLYTFIFYNMVDHVFSAWQFLSARNLFIASTTWYSEVCLLFGVTSFACDIDQSASIWIWVSSEVITMCFLVNDWSISRVETRSKQLSTVRSLDSMMSLSRKVFYVVISLASLLCLIQCISSSLQIIRHFNKSYVLKIFDIRVLKFR